MKDQFPLIPEAIKVTFVYKSYNFLFKKAFNVTFITQHGIEADDIIATYAKIAEKKGHKVYNKLIIK